MDQHNATLASGLVSSTYIQQGADALCTRRKLIKTLLSQRSLPKHGWDEDTVELFIKDAAYMDSNNFLNSVGVGEREARVASRLVAKRHFGLAHGIGRSGDVAAEQPKAAGSSLLAKMTNILVQDALKVAGMLDVGAVTVLPLATGMALTLTLLALKAKRPQARYVLWPRIDQKTCLKAIVSANLEAVPVPCLLEGDELRTDMPLLRSEIERLSPDKIVCIVTTTSCFAPRGADSLVEVAKLCRESGIGHIVNNAYGVQSAALCSLVTSAWRKGRVDAVVQSTDKNFMVPVGGAVVAAGIQDTSLVNAVNKAYPGRASMTPLLDVLITLLQWGVSGWRNVLEQREAVYRYAHVQLEAFAATINERVLTTPNNPISIGLTLANLRQVGPLSVPADQTDRNSQDSSNLQRGTSSTPASQSSRPTHVATVTEHSSAPLSCEAAELVGTSARDLSKGYEAGARNRAWLGIASEGMVPTVMGTPVTT
ncbi:g6356 [Coccomyxa elongata]